MPPLACVSDMAIGAGRFSVALRQVPSLTSDEKRPFKLFESLASPEVRDEDSNWHRFVIRFGGDSRVYPGARQGQRKRKTSPGSAGRAEETRTAEPARPRAGQSPRTAESRATKPRAGEATARFRQAAATQQRTTATTAAQYRTAAAANAQTAGTAAQLTRSCSKRSGAT